MEQYDVMIVGGGPAGLTAGLYCARSGLRAVVFEGELTGGQASTTNELENYPGYMRIGGPELMMAFEAQAKAAGAEIRYQAVKKVNLVEKTIATRREEFAAKAIILTTGAKRAKLNVPGEAEYTGRGVSYCATCDGAMYKGKPVAVVGGGNTAMEDAIYLAGLGCAVTLIHRRNEFRASEASVKKVLELQNVTPCLDSVVEKIEKADEGLSLTITNVKTGEKHQEKVSGCFIAVGTKPETGLFEGQLEMEKGYVLTDEEMTTSVPGVFAAGDLRKKTLRQVITAAADGAIASDSALKYIRSLA